MTNDLLPPGSRPPNPNGGAGRGGNDRDGSGGAGNGAHGRASSGGTGRRIAIVSLGAVAAVTVLWGTLSAADLVARSETTETFTRDTVPRLRITTDGQVEVSAGAVDEISIVRTVERGLRDPEFGDRVVTTPAGDELVLSGECPRAVSSWCSVDYAVVVPADTEVVVDADAGSVTVTGIDGDVTASSSAGAVTAIDLGGTLRLSSSAGRVHGEDLRSTDVEASSSAGGVRLVFADPPTSVDADSSAGSVEVVVPDDGAVYAVDASTSAGSTRIAVPTDPSADRTLRLRSDAGNVSVRHLS